jgi:hypothetical protein
MKPPMKCATRSSKTMPARTERRAEEADARLGDYLAGMATAMALGLVVRHEDDADPTKNVSPEDRVALKEIASRLSNRLKSFPRKKKTRASPLLRGGDARRSRRRARSVEVVGKPPSRARDRAHCRGPETPQRNRLALAFEGNHFELDRPTRGAEFHRIAFSRAEKRPPDRPVDAAPIPEKRMFLWAETRR